jgi:hypothetical protein
MASKTVIAVLAAVLLVAAAMGTAESHQCNVGALKVCAPAFTKGAPPTASCCASIRSQESCLCHYANNPAYSRYIPNARKTLSSCGIPEPTC